MKHIIALAWIMALSSVASAQTRVGPVDYRNFDTAPVTAAGATTFRTLAEIGSDVINVKFGWGGAPAAKGDTIGVSNCYITAGTTLLSCASASFTAADAGKRYYLQGSGAANTPQTGTISSYVSATSVNLSQAAVVTTRQGGIYSPPMAPVTIASAGTGYTDGTQTLTITGGSCTTQPQVSVTVTGGEVTAVLGMVDPGVCLNAPSSGAATTGGGGTGATFNTSGFSVAGRLIYGTDDTAAVTAAFTEAVATGKTLVFPAGGYWLATASAAIPVNNVTVRGEGAGGYNWPFMKSGSWLLISNQASPTLTGMQGVNWSGVNIYYPEQDGATVTPIVYPALFSASQWVNVLIENSRFVNPYILSEITNVAGSGLGRVTLDRVAAYCVLYCFKYLNGQADVLTIGANNTFSPGAADNEIPYGRANLGRYTATNGSFIYIDVGAGAYPAIDGLMLSDFIVHGYRYGINLVSGRVGVSNISNINWDAVQTPYRVAGTSSWISTSVKGGEIYSTNIYNAAANGSVFDVTSTGQVDLHVTGVRFTFALGHVVADLGSGVRAWNFTGNQISNWGRTTTAGTYYGMLVGANGSENVFNFTGNSLKCANSGSVIKSGVLTNSLLNFRANITGNTLVSCWNDFVVSGNAGAVSIVGNTTLNTGSRSLWDASTSDALVFASNNVFSGARLRRPPALTSCGASPSIPNTSSNQSGVVTVGTGGVTSCTLTFTSALPQIPDCSGGTNSAAITASVTSVSTTSVVFGFSADASGQMLRYKCDL